MNPNQCWAKSNRDLIVT